MENIKKKKWENANYPIVRIPKNLYNDVKAFADKRNLSIGEVLNWAWYKGIKEYEKVEFPTFKTMREKMEREIKAKLEDEIRADYESKIKALENENKELVNMIRDASFHYEQMEKKKEALENQLKEQNGINAMLKQRIDDLENEIKEYEKSMGDLANLDLLKSENASLKAELERYKKTDLDGLIKENAKLKDDIRNLTLELSEERHRNDEVIREMGFMKNEVCKELKALSDKEPAFKVQLLWLIEEIKRKCDYELGKF